MGRGKLTEKSAKLPRPLWNKNLKSFNFYLTSANKSFIIIDMIKGEKYLGAERRLK